MRTSRVSRETARLFDHASTSPSPRRSTRSLARFSYGATPSSPTVKNEPADIEDAITRPRAKRVKREHNTTATESKAQDVKSEIKEEDEKAEGSSSKAPRRQRKPARTTTDRVTGQVKVEPPSDWEAMYEAVRRMRAPGGAAYGAAVDTMGCERLADRSASPKDQRFQTLISLMLSSQTKDTTNAAAMARLRNELPPHKIGAPKGLNLDNILAVTPHLLNELIWAVGFHNNKTKYIKQAAEILRDEWDGDIPDTIEGLTSLPGVGPKMAYLCLSVAWNRTEGIGVDVHVHRITNMWGWHKTKNPEETRLSLQSWLPRDRWREINGLLVGLGQAVCLPVGSKCGDCDLGLKGMCKAADRKKVAEGLKRLKLEDEDVKPEHAEEEFENPKTEEDTKDGLVKQEPHVAVKDEHGSIEMTTPERWGAVPNGVTASVKEEHGVDESNASRGIKKEEDVSREVKVKIEQD